MCEKMKHRQLIFRFISVIFVFCLVVTASGAETPQSGDVTPAWFYPAWLASGPHSPVFQVRDTENKYGRYAAKTKTITVKDMIKFHGHFCGGLVESASSLRVAFDLLFPGGIVDRTDLQIISNNSACGADVASYLTGARTRFNSHIIDNSLTESEFYVRQVSTGKTVHVKLNPEMYPKEVKTLMRKIESGHFTPQDIDRFQDLQWEYAKRMVSRPIAESFIVREVTDYPWPAPSCKDFGKRRDNDYRNVPRN